MTEIVAALVDAINSSTRSLALSPLARVKYPMREFRPTFNADGTMVVTLAKRGWEYKRRGPRPKIPPPVDTAAIQAVLSAALPDGYIITAVQDKNTHILLQIRR